MTEHAPDETVNTIEEPVDGGAPEAGETKRREVQARGPRVLGRVLGGRCPPPANKHRQSSSSSRRAGDDRAACV